MGAVAVGAEAWSLHLVASTSHHGEKSAMVRKLKHPEPNLGTSFASKEDARATHLNTSRQPHDREAHHHRRQETCLEPTE